MSDGLAWWCPVYIEFVVYTRQPKVWASDLRMSNPPNKYGIMPDSAVQNTKLSGIPATSYFDVVS